MKTLELVRQKQRLDALFEKVQSLDSDPELQSHWARYLCVLVSGFIEVFVRKVMSDHAEARSDVRIANFVEREVRYLQDAKISKILEWVERFDAQWKDDLEKKLDDRHK